VTATRIMALDPGTKRIGVALSDELGWTAQPLETFERRTLAQDVAHIQRLVQEHAVREIVMGLPIRLNGDVGPEAEGVKQFIQQLEQSLTVPVVPWDERLTTKSAEELLIQANVSRKKRRGVVDRVAAAILLQSYLRSLSTDQASFPAGDSPAAGTAADPPGPPEEP
jgi:putative Holliday junction resolvase